jgi:hypothetical protein
MSTEEFGFEVTFGDGPFVAVDDLRRKEDIVIY